MDNLSGFQKKWLSHLVLLSGLMLITPSPVFAGGADGGTNVSRNTMEPVEFEKPGGDVRIDPRTFENIASDLEPVMKGLDDRIPGIRAELEEFYTSKKWFVTTEKFRSRNHTEVQPIYQDSDRVRLNIDEVVKMTKKPDGHEKLKKAFFHELVRGFAGKYFTKKYVCVRRNDSACIMYSWQFASQQEIDGLVEEISRRLYNGYRQSFEDTYQMVLDLNHRIHGYFGGIGDGYYNTDKYKFLANGTAAAYAQSNSSPATIAEVAAKLQELNRLPQSSEGGKEAGMFSKQLAESSASATMSSEALAVQAQ